MNTNNEALNEVINVLKTNFINSQAQKQSETNEMINSLELMELIYNSIPESATKTVFMEARSDLMNSMIFCFQGFYRQANICLRSSIELIISFLYYYDNQYDFVLWKNDCIDMTWSQLTNKDKGVFNSKFLSIVFESPLSIDKCLSEIQRMYHLTSQYVHGKYEYMQQRLSDKIVYSESLINDFFASSKIIIELEITLLYIRFIKYITKKLDSTEVSNLNTLLKKYEVV